MAVVLDIYKLVVVLVVVVGVVECFCCYYSRSDNGSVV